MLSLLATILASAPPTGFTVAVDRVAVRRVSPQVSVETETMTGRVVLRGLALAAKAPRLCPTVEKRKDGAVVLTCTSRRIWAGMGDDVRGSFIDLRQLTAISWAEPSAQLPMRPWPLKVSGIPDQCPGTNSAARAECAFDRGELEAAETGWKEALNGPDLSLAHLRLGDLALSRGDVEAALKHYAATSPTGPVGRLAQVRSCELIGSCLSVTESARMGNTDAMPPEIAREVVLHHIRRELVAGRDADAMTMLTAKLESDPLFCEGVTLPLCQRMIEGGLTSNDVEARISALSVFLSDKARRGPFELILNDEAATTARELGAPGFAASILASNTPRIPRAELSEHLLEIVRLYVAARDPVRAAVVLEYAEGKLGATTRAGGWVSVRRQLGGRSNTTAVAPVVSATDDRALEELSSQVSLSTDLARAAAARSRAIEDVPSAPETAP